MISQINENNLNGILSENDTVIIKFGAEWCSPCKATEPQYEKISKKYESILMCKYDIDDNPEGADTFKIRNIPCIIVFNAGAECERFVGSTCVSDLDYFLSN